MEARRPQSILVVDDLPDNLDLLCEHLEDEELYQVRTADGGEAALAAAAEAMPDLVLLDVMMPDIDGIEVCRRIKAMASDRFMPIVLITAHSDLENKRLGLKAGADDFISKPFDRIELMARIRNLLHTKHLYDRLNDAHEQIDREVKEIANLQRSLIPGLHPQIEGLEFNDYYMPSSQAGGDFFDYVTIDKNHLGIAMGDVSGHGPPASVIMAMVKMILHLSEPLWMEPAQLLTHAEQHLSKFIPPCDFVTMFYGVLHIPSKTMRFTSAGHCAPVLFGEKYPEPYAIKSEEGFPLCLVPGEENPFEEITVRFEPGSRLLLYTDGLVEVQNEERQLWGMKSLFNTLQANQGLSGNDLIIKLIETASDYNHLDSFRDDCTLLMLDWKS